MPLCIFFPVLRIDTPLFQRPLFSPDFFLRNLPQIGKRKHLKMADFVPFPPKKHPTSLKIYWRVKCAHPAILLALCPRVYGTLCEMYGIFRRFHGKLLPIHLKKRRIQLLRRAPFCMVCTTQLVSNSNYARCIFRPLRGSIFLYAPAWNMQGKLNAFRKHVLT